MKTSEIITKINKLNPKSAWTKGVKQYALDMINYATEGNQETEIPTENKAQLEGYLLNGAFSWTEASDGGSFEIYDTDIAKKLCTPTELKITRNGERNPNNREKWLDVQTRALHQACNLIWKEIK